MQREPSFEVLARPAVLRHCQKRRAGSTLFRQALPRRDRIQAPVEHQPVVVKPMAAAR